MNEIKSRIKKSIAAKEAMLSKCSKAIEKASNAMYQAVKKIKRFCGVEMVVLLQTLNTWQLN